MKKFLPLILILAVWIIPQKLFAATMVLQQGSADVAQQQQFYVDVQLDPQGGDFNGIQGNVTFSSDTLSFVRAETGTSIVNYFIDQPTVTGNTLNFSGIVVGGFNGLIDPFNQSHKFPGEIIRLVFAGKAAGDATIATSHVSVTENNRSGTLQHIADTSISLNVSSAVAPSVYNTADTVAPTISAVIVHEHDLYDGKYTLLYTATDKQSGIDHVELREGNGQWQTIQSPYLMHDQTRNSILSLRAYDVSGNVTTITIPSNASSQSTAAAIGLLLIVLIILYVIYKKTKHPKHTT